MRALAAHGSHILTATAEEAQLAIACGFPPDRVAFQRPILTESELGRVLDAGVRRLHVDHPQQIDLLESVAAARRVAISVSLRARVTGIGVWRSPTALLGTRLGLRASDLFPVCARLLDSRWLRPCALNFYVGTQRPNTRPYRQMLNVLCGITARLEQGLGLRLDEINLGGGIPSPGARSLRSARAQEDRGTDATEGFCRDLSLRVHAAVRAARMVSRPRIAAEPGRAIVGNAAVLVTRVRAVGNRWLFLDVSRNHFGEVMSVERRRVFPVRNGESRRRWTGLSGSTLNVTDVLGFARNVSSLAVSDLLVFADAGAYSISRASRSAGLAPAVLMVGRDGEPRVIRRRESFDDLVSAMVMDGESP